MLHFCSDALSPPFSARCNQHPLDDVIAVTCNAFLANSILTRAISVNVHPGGVCTK